MINYRGAGAVAAPDRAFRRIDAETVRYEVTVADPTTFSRPWTAALSLEDRDHAGRVRVRVPRRQLRDAQHPQRRPRSRSKAARE